MDEQVRMTEDTLAAVVVRVATAEEGFERLREAVRRVNVDWDVVAASCGDPKCNGDCRWVEELRVLAL